MGAVCAACTEREDFNGAQRVQVKSRQVIDGNHFSHHFAADNPGCIDKFYDVDYKKPLGEGAYGKAYNCTSKKSGLARAVKSVNLTTLKNEGGNDALAAWQNEVEISKMLDHPNIIKLHETFSDKHSFYLIMEVLSGGELFDRIVSVYENGKFTEERVAKYVGEILRGIAYMHKQFVAHRDLKPENFLLQDKSDNAEVKIIDFGISKQFTPGVPMKTQKGTPMYIAPEVLSSRYDEKCDVWSVGVITYILMCGFPPFSGDDDKKTLAQVRKGLGKSCFKDDAWKPVSQAAKDFVTDMLIKEPAKRPTASSALDLGWLHSKEQAMCKKITGQTGLIKKLRMFNDARKLKKVALTMIATQLQDKDIEELRAQFKALDKDGDGSISLKELEELLKTMPDNTLTIDDFKSLDSDGSGEIDYTEFIAAALDKRHYTKRENAKIAFNQFDIDGNGKITLDELKQIMAGNSGQSLSNERIAAMIAENDKDGDGEIDFEEFMEMMLNDDPGLDHIAGDDNS